MLMFPTGSPTDTRGGFMSKRTDHDCDINILAKTVGRFNSRRKQTTLRKTNKNIRQTNKKAIEAPKP